MQFQELLCPNRSMVTSRVVTYPLAFLLKSGAATQRKGRQSGSVKPVSCLAFCVNHNNNDTYIALDLVRNRPTCILGSTVVQASVFWCNSQPTIHYAMNNTGSSICSIRGSIHAYTTTTTTTFGVHVTWVRSRLFLVSEGNVQPIWSESVKNWTH